MPTASASFPTSRKAGGRPIGSSPCVTKRSPKPATADEPEQYQLFDTPNYAYRVFVTNMKRTLDLLVWFYGEVSVSVRDAD